jgi:hypothetical protein
VLKKIKKITNNIFSIRGLKVLGLFNYSRYLTLILLNIFEILKEGNLKLVDKKMGKLVKKFSYNGRKIFFDCSYIDNLLNEESYSFGLIRELLIRDCYFKFMPEQIYLNSKIVVDLGANRGLFSMIMSKTSDFIISVEGQNIYKEIIEYNFRNNLFDNFYHETCFVGGIIDNDLFRNSGEIKTYDIPHFLKKYNLQSIDLLKIDIEGSEFDLFNGDSEWLKQIKAIVMEVHPNEGDPEIILNRLSAYNFKVKIADEDLNLIEEAKKTTFIYALNRSFY